MSEVDALNSPAARIVTGFEHDPHPSEGRRSRATLQSLDDVARELARVYRRADRGAMPWGEATKAAFILTSLGKVLEAAVIEQRLTALEGLVNEQAEAT